jgi:hypothetical protein
VQLSTALHICVYVLMMLLQEAAGARSAAEIARLQSELSTATTALQSERTAVKAKAAAADVAQVCVQLDMFSLVCSVLCSVSN